jgi:hypothetical protein
MAKDKRVEVLFDESQYRTLEEHAQREGKSVGGLIREAVAKYVTEPTEERRRQALEWILSQEPIELPEWEVLKEEMAQDRYDAVMKSMGLDQTTNSTDEAD